MKNASAFILYNYEERGAGYSIHSHLNRDGIKTYALAIESFRRPLSYYCVMGESTHSGYNMDASKMTNIIIESKIILLCCSYSYLFKYSEDDVLRSLLKKIVKKRSLLYQSYLNM